MILTNCKRIEQVCSKKSQPKWQEQSSWAHTWKKMKNRNFVSLKLSKPTYYIYKQTALLKTKSTCKTAQAFIVYSLVKN